MVPPDLSFISQRDVKIFAKKFYMPIMTVIITPAVELISRIEYKKGAEKAPYPYFYFYQ